MKYHIAELDPTPYTDQYGPYRRLRIVEGARRWNRGHWDLFDLQTGTLRCLPDAPKYLLAAARALLDQPDPAATDAYELDLRDRG